MLITILLHEYPADFGDEFVSGTSFVGANLSLHRLIYPNLPPLPRQMVDIYLDSQYGSFVFVTVGGPSKCPNEVGTSAVEDPYIKIVESTRQPVVADDEV